MLLTEQDTFRERLRELLPERIYLSLVNAGYDSPQALGSIRTPYDGLRIKGIGKCHLPVLLEAIPTILDQSIPPTARYRSGPSPDDLRLFETYCRTKTYQATADALGLQVREVSKYLDRGAKAGWWHYEPQSEHREQALRTVIPRDVLIQSFRKHIATYKVAEDLCLTVGAVHSLAQDYGYTVQQLTAIGRQYRLALEIDRLLEDWQRLPTKKELREHPDWRRVYSRIRVHWRTFEGYLDWKKANL